MLLSAATSWKLVLFVVLVAGVLASARIQPPRRSLPGAELGRLVLGALALYGAGLAASRSHHPILAVVMYAGGITVSALAAWLSRGADSRSGPPPENEPGEDDPTPPAPDGAPRFDWQRFERDFADYARRAREPSRTR
jgi:hypothetical protein